MSSLRVKFNRGEQVKFISHLDLMKAFERAIRRSGLPIAYSQGFNPHPAMVFGLPLSVGVTSEAEYADFETAVDIQPEEFAERLNKELPEGLKIITAGIKTSGGNIMAVISAAVYEITLILDEKLEKEEFENKLKDYLGRNTIITRKESKNGSKDIEIRPMIRQLKAEKLDIMPSGYEDYTSAFRITALLNAGSVSNLKPELVANSMRDLEGLKVGAVRIHRKELFTGVPDKLVNPLNKEY